MKGSEKMAVYVGTFVFVIVGYIVSLIVSDFLTNVFSSGVEIDFLTTDRLSWLIFAIGWLIVCFLVNYGSTRWLEEGEKVGILSLFFLILWFISTLAIVIGYIIKTLLEGGATLITLDSLLDELFVALFWALAPTIAALLGVSNKSRHRD
ncbi:MAG: hypothetical protein ACFE9L_20940 [Candidatus Hodarchaeota archaeon]